MSDSGGTGGLGHTQPGPVYDAAARGTVEGGLAPVFEALDLPPPRVPGRAGLQPTEFPGQTLRADLLVQVGRGKPLPGGAHAGDGLVHVEYQTSARSGIARRMLEYRGRVSGRHPDQRVRQYVLVLGDGDVDSCDDSGTGFSLALRPIYLRERDPAAFLRDPASAPFAVLAAGDRATRTRSLVAAIRLIMAQGGARTAELLESTQTLAAIRLDDSTIDDAWKECGMTVEAKADFYARFDGGQELLRRGRAEGEARGRAEGEAHGEVLVLTALLRSRFGDHPQLAAVAERLATWADPEAAVHAVTTATGLDDIPATGDDLPVQRNR